MIWATISSQSCFCWLYRASPSLPARNVINMISVLAISWCSRVGSSFVLLERVFAMTSAFSWQNSISLYPASFSTPRPNLPVTPGVSWLPTFASRPYNEKDIFWGVISKITLLQHHWLGHRLGLLWYWMVCLGIRNHSVVFEIASKYCISDSFVDYDGYSISSKGFLPTVVDTMVIWVKFTHSSPF